jgi:hypothetical protein
VAPGRSDALGRRSLVRPADFYESSDYAYLYYVCDELNAFKNADGRCAHSAMMFAALNQAMSVLLLTEGDRRRVRIELQHEELVDSEARKIVEDCYAEAVRLLAEHRDQLSRLAHRLLETVTLDEEDA